MTKAINLTPGEKRLLTYFLERLENQMDHCGCCDMDQEVSDCLSKKEWGHIAREQRGAEGDVEDLTPNDALNHLRKKLGL